MDINSILENYFTISEENQQWLIKLGIDAGIFFGFILLSVLGGRYTPTLIRLLVSRFFPKQFSKLYLSFVEPIEPSLRATGTLILLLLSLGFIQDYPKLYQFLYFFVNLSVIISIAWLCSRLFRQFLRTYGISLLQKLGREIDELLLVLETIANILIGFTAVIAFAQSQEINLIGLLASLGIGGIALAFAAQKTLEQLIGTIVLYLDRPYIPGEYIRVNFNPHDDDVFARVESIGIRSTKLRVAAKSTLIIVPNSIMATKDIENITRGKKVMVLLYLNFSEILQEKEQAFVKQVIKESTDTLFGIDPGSTKIHLFEPDGKSITRARITFFILGSSENSLQLRKRLLELANDMISKKLTTYQIQFQMEDPTIYVDSPITI